MAEFLIVDFRLSIARALSLALAGIFALSACGPRLTKEQRALRNDLRDALAQQQYDRAVELGQRAVADTPHDEEAWDRLVQAYFARNDLAGVRRALDAWRVSVEKPGAKLDEYRGDLALAEKDPAAALQFWQKARKAAPKEHRVVEKMARAEEQQRHWEQADQLWSEAIHAREHAASRAARALVRRHLRKWDDATADLRAAQRLDANDPEVQRAAKLFNRIGPLLAEIRELDARLILHAEDAGLLADRALLLLRTGDPELALDDLEAAARLDERLVRPRLFKAIALLDLGRANECDALGVERFIRLDALRPDLLETFSRLDAEISVERNNADLYATRAWQLNEIAQPRLALQDAERAAELDPASGGALAEGGYALMKLGRADEAWERVRKATEADPKFATGWHYRGELEMFRGDYVAAVESLTRALTMNQTAAALQKREECYRHLGLLANADADHRAWTDLQAREAK